MPLDIGASSWERVLYKRIVKIISLTKNRRFFWTVLFVDLYCQSNYTLVSSNFLIDTINRRDFLTVEMILAEPTGCHHQFIVLLSDMYKKKKKIHKYAKFHVNSITERDEILHARLDDILTNKQTSGQVKISKSRKNKDVFKLTCISVSLCNGFLFLLINSGMCIGF